ncbi:hypothetical protein [Roseomonas elaeocarpi]|uniref:hypothetical protein n=1 Tax=Roseomonas elaeocarpi TaxID=907779 RepID=UPI00366D7C73
MALSGGGTKAAVFSGEALFYLDFLGLLGRTSVLSSVSGGSFAGSVYALSCDPDTPCQGVQPHGRERPVWLYEPVMRTLGQGYKELIREQAVRAFMPLVPSTVSAGRFAEIIDRQFLGEGRGGRDPFTFGDLNPARPHLFLNATITSENRVGLGSQVAQAGCWPLPNRGFLRRRTPDEYFHFAFSDLYFGMLKSRVSDYPLASGVAASSAFPALIDFAQLQDYCATKDSERTVLLMDGGANDNQALIEIYMILSELVYGQHRSDLWQLNPRALETLSGQDRAFVIVINSSVTEMTGADVTRRRPFGLIGLLDAVLSKSLAAIDVYSAEGYTLRKQSYLTLADLLRQTQPQAAPVYPSEIALTALDQYVLGGTEAALRGKAQAADAPGADIATAWAERRAERQRRAYDAIVERPEVRDLLRLPSYHPQCYFDMRKALDASLVSLDEQDQACLQEGARWATALRAQEMCDSADPFVARPDGLRCEGGHVVPDPARITRLPPLPSPSRCEQRVQAYLSKPSGAQAIDQRLQCRRL